jgi:hypothetical protein
MKERAFDVMRPPREREASLAAASYRRPDNELVRFSVVQLALVLGQQRRFRRMSICPSDWRTAKLNVNPLRLLR